MPPHTLTFEIERLISSRRAEDRPERRSPATARTGRVAAMMERAAARLVGQQRPAAAPPLVVRWA